jgi:hypothetical protein
MILRTNISGVMERTKRFYGKDEKGSALIHVTEIKSIKKIPIKPLNQWNFHLDLKEYLDAHIQSLEQYWMNRMGVDDDLIPAISPWFGIAEHSAFVGGEVDFSSESSWHHPIIKKWSDLDRLQLREDSIWLRRVVDGMIYLKEQSNERYAVRLRGADGPMDIANALRGNDLFTDFFDYPEEVKRLMEFCSKAVEWTMSRQMKAIGPLEGGYLTGFDVWLPGKSMGHLSEDAAALCSPSIYEVFGLPYTKSLCASYDNVLMHVHSKGKHCLKLIASIPEITCIEISSDPKSPRAIEIYKAMADQLKDKVVVVALTKEELKENVEFLKSVKTIIRYVAEDVDDARNTVQYVRHHLAV